MARPKKPQSKRASAGVRAVHVNIDASLYEQVREAQAERRQTLRVVVEDLLRSGLECSARAA